jgi:hypothetical protein
LRFSARGVNKRHKNERKTKCKTIEKNKTFKVIFFLRVFFRFFAVSLDEEVWAKWPSDQTL